MVPSYQEWWGSGICDQLSYAALYSATCRCDGTIGARSIRHWRHSSPFSTLGGVLAYRKSGFLHRSLILYMGSSILAGSLLGSYVSHFMPENGMNLVYGLLAIVAVVLMLIPKRDSVQMQRKKSLFIKDLRQVLPL